MPGRNTCAPVHEPRFLHKNVAPPPRSFLCAGGCERCPLHGILAATRRRSHAVWEARGGGDGMLLLGGVALRRCEAHALLAGFERELPAGALALFWRGVRGGRREGGGGGRPFVVIVLLAVEGQFPGGLGGLWHVLEHVPQGAPVRRLLFPLVERPRLFRRTPSLRGDLLLRCRLIPSSMHTRRPRGTRGARRSQRASRRAHGLTP